MTQPLLVRAGWMIDGSGGPIRRRVVLRLSNGRIRAVETTESADFPVKGTPDPTEKQVYWVPTAAPMAAYAELLGSGSRRDVARRTLDHQLGQIARAGQLGVPMVLGTDAGSLGVHHGPGVAQEMRLLMSAGISLEQAVACATAAGARLLGLDDQGLLSTGMRATFVAVRGGPDGLPESLNPVSHVFIDGNRVQIIQCLK